MKCWVREKNGDEDWTLIRDPSFNSSNLEYYVGHEPPPPPKRTITLTVNGREWVLPKPFKSPTLGDHYWCVLFNGQVRYASWCGAPSEKYLLSDNRIYTAEDDAQAWAEFDKWCRGGGV